MSFVIVEQSHQKDNYIFPPKSKEEIYYKYDVKFFLGFINALITELWANLECGRDDVRVTHPRYTPVDPIDQSCQKVRNDLSNNV